MLVFRLPTAARRSLASRSHQAGLQIIGGVARHSRPDFRRRPANALAIGLRPRAGHADGDDGWDGHLRMDKPKMSGKLRVGQQP